MESQHDDKGTLSLMDSIDSSHDGTLDRSFRESRDTKVVRKLTLVDGVAIVVGIIIGSGIFSSPGLALERAGSPGVVLIAWSASGILVMLAAQCYMELGGMMPSAGGDFDYLTRAYGERMGFAFAWFNIFVSKTGSQAIIATIFGRYFESAVNGNTSSLTSGKSEESSMSKLLAVLLITFITLVNCAGVKESAYVSLVLTVIKVSLVLSVFVFAIVYASSGGSYADNFIDNLAPAHSFDNSNSIFKFGSAMVACLWCFDGFADGNFLQEEMINPTRDLPRLIRVGLMIVTSCYLLINVGYLSVLSRDTIVDSKAIAVEFGITFSNLFSTGKAILPGILAMGVSMSTMGSINGSIMTGGRAFYAVARANKFPPVMAKINRFGAPWVALVVQGVWSIVLLLMPGSNFSTLLDYFGPTSWLFYAFSASAVIILRYKEPDTVRPFKVMWYPLPPILVILIALVIFISSMMSEPLFTLLAIGFVSLAFPVHLGMEWYDAHQAGQGGGRKALATSDDIDEDDEGHNYVAHNHLHGNESHPGSGNTSSRPSYNVQSGRDRHQQQQNSTSSLSNSVVSVTSSYSGYSSKYSGHQPAHVLTAAAVSGDGGSAMRIKEVDPEDLQEVEIDLFLNNAAVASGRNVSPVSLSPLGSPRRRHAANDVESAQNSSSNSSNKSSNNNNHPRSHSQSLLFNGSGVVSSLHQEDITSSQGPGGVTRGSRASSNGLL